VLENLNNRLEGRTSSYDRFAKSHVTREVPRLTKLSQIITLGDSFFKPGAITIEEEEIGELGAMAGYGSGRKWCVCLSVS